MASDNEIPLEITANATNAAEAIKDLTKVYIDNGNKIDQVIAGKIQKPLEDFAKKAEESNKRLEKSFETLREVGLIALEIFAAREIIHFLTEIIGEASKADQAVRSLGVALAGTGEFSDEAVTHFKEFAHAIQETTTLSEEAALNAVTLAKSFGLSNDASEKLTKAAIDLAAATGTDLNSAVEKLGATYSGQIGRLGKVTPALKNLTEEQLKQGAAIDILAAKYAGFAEATTQTFGGALTKTQHEFEDVFKGLGQIITQNPVVLASINALGKAFAAIAEFVGENKDSLNELLSTAIKGLISTLPTLIKAFAFLVAAMSASVDITADLVLAVLELYKAFVNITKPIRDFLNVLGNAFLSVIGGVIGGILEIARAVPGIGSGLSKLGIDVDKLQESVDNFTGERLTDALNLDTSVSDSFQKFIVETTNNVEDFTDNSRKKVNGFLEVVGVGAIKVADYAQTAVDGILKVGDASVSVTAGIKNLNKEFDDSERIRKLLESVKGSFEKIKGAIEALQQEIDKQTLSANALIDAEEQRAKQLFKNATLELQLTGKITKAQKEQLDNIDNLTEAEKNQLALSLGANNKILVQYDNLIKKKADLARQKLGIGDFTIPEVFSSIADAVGAVSDAVAEFNNTSFDETSLEGIGNSIGDGFVNIAEKAGKSIGESLAKTSLKDIGTGIVDSFQTIGQVIDGAFQFGAKVLSGVLNGEFIKSGFDLVQQFLQFPKSLSDIFTNFGGVVNDLLASLPTIISNLIQNLPQIAAQIAENLGKVIDLIADNAPKIFDSLTQAVGTLLDKLVQKLPAIGGVIADSIVKSTDLLAEKLPSIITALAQALDKILSAILNKALPRIIEALPEIVRSILQALPGLIDTILKALPNIITLIFKAIPKIIKEIADALPDIIIAIVDNLPDIALAFVQGMIELMPEIVDALVTSLLVDGGLERIVKGIIAAIPRIAVALAQGFVRGIYNAFIQGGQTAGKVFVAAIQNVGSKIGGDFIAKITGPFQGLAKGFGDIFNINGSNFLSGLSNTFSLGGSGIFGSITAAFQGAISGLYGAIIGAFTSVFGGLYGTIIGAFNSIFGGLYGTIVTAFQNIFGGIGNAIADGGARLRDAFLEPVNKLIGFLGNFKFPDIGGGVGGILGGSGGGIGGAIGGAASSVGGALGFAGGGVVPAGFPNDSLPAPNLSSGELVVDKGLTGRLDNFLSSSGNSGGGDTLIATLLSQISQKLDQPVQAESSVQIDGRAFADIILNLSRNNARLTA